ncbi:hypothetical protein FHS18_002612 [Paenibacillus phyllosphaerae]|uniref:Uncharacterized protein n=1 Tax=Paenibacillus phyllosphaerae TaxID=274593 RepID=A0A7W5FMS3_9BACL|nr:hypothetical protein [Paenibacillus phyllosphaerae]
MTTSCVIIAQEIIGHGASTQMAGIGNQRRTRAGKQQLHEAIMDSRRVKE